MRKFPSGQGIPEYVLTLAVLGLAFWAGARAWQHASQRLDADQAWYLFLPSP